MSKQFINPLGHPALALGTPKCSGALLEIWDKVFVCKINFYLGLIFKCLTECIEVLLEI